jgi:RNA polymerase sigma factor (sigma-70 family)
MIKTAPSPILKLIRQVADDPRGRESSDRELVERFSGSRDEAAFDALLRRHGSMVLDLCRAMLGNEADAEDAFQATFLVLAHKARAIRRHNSVGSWLYGVAYRTALKAQADFARRKKHEARAPARPSASDELSWRDVQQVVHAELNRLGERYRAPLVLCYLQCQSQDEAAAHLAISKAALKKRLERGRALLRTRLARRGLGPVAALVASAWPAAGAAATVPGTLASLTATAALRIAASQAAGVSAPVAALAAGVLKTMFLTQFKTVTIALLAALTLGGASYCLTLGASPDRAKAALMRGEQIAASQANRAVPQKVEALSDLAIRAKAEELRGEAIAHLADALKKLDAAPKVAHRLTHRTLMDLAVLQTKLGDRAGASKTFGRVREMIDGWPDNHELRLLARAYAEAGEVDEALNVAKGITEDVAGYRDIALQEVAETLAKAGREKEALQAVDLIGDQSRKGWAQPMVVRTIALHRAENGKIAEALQLLDKITDPRQRVQLLAGMEYLNYSWQDLPSEPGIALLESERGNRAGALKTLARAVEIAGTVETGRDGALLALVCAQARLGELAAAEKSIAGMEHPVGKTLALAALARGRVRAGRAKEALAAAENIADHGQRFHVLMHIALEQHKAGVRPASRQTFQAAGKLLESLNDRLTHAPYLVSALAAAGDYQAALQIITAHIEPALGPLRGHAGPAYSTIVYFQAQAGDIQGALDTANRFKEDEPWRGTMLRGIAGSQVERGSAKNLARNHADALRWIRELDSDLDQADALLGLAEGLVKRCDAMLKKKQ